MKEVMNGVGARAGRRLKAKSVLGFVLGFVPGLAAWIVLGAAATAQMAPQAGSQAQTGSQAQPGGAQAQAAPQAQSNAEAEAQPGAQTAAPLPPRGTVLFQSHGEPPEPSDASPAQPGSQPEAAGQPAASAEKAAPAGPAAPSGPTTPSGPAAPMGLAAQSAAAELTDAERASLRFTAYDLDARFSPASSGVVVRARVTLKNVGPALLARVAMQLSSTLRWESVSLLTGGGAEPATTGVRRLDVSQHLLDTDADHTGQASEVIVSLPQPLAPGESLQLDTFYSGTLAASRGRLLRLGATAAQADASDWDAVGDKGIALRGFGNVLWYPVASPQLFLGEGAQLFAAVGAMRLDEQEARIRLKLTVDYSGEAPAAAYFCGRRQAFTALPDSGDAPIASATGLVTADFPAESLGFREPSLFTVNQPEKLTARIGIGLTGIGLSGIGRGGLGGRESDGSGDLVGIATSSTPSPAAASSSLPPSATPHPADSAAAQSSADAAVPAPTAPGISSSSSAGAAAETSSPAEQTPDQNAEQATQSGLPILAVESDNDGAVAALGQSATQIAPLLQQWMGEEPLSALTVIDHAGQPFEDGPLLVAPALELAQPEQRTALAHSLAHAWVQTGQPWMDEGLAQFFALLWTEHEVGREKALSQLDELLQPLPLVEPEISPVSAKEPGAAHELVGQVVGQPLVAASSEVYYRRKAAAVWWMLRSIAGDDALSAALEQWRQRLPGKETAEQDALAFEHTIEHAGPQNSRNPIDLRWFFNDWVLHDRGLPDLSITDVTPRVIPSRPGQGASAAFLVSVTVRNDGAAEAEVPVTIRSRTYSTTSQLRVPGFASSAARVVVETAPEEVSVNDGSVPEVRTMFHTVKVSGVKTQ